MTKQAVAKRTALSDVPGLNAFRKDLERFIPQFAGALAGRMDPEHFIEVVTTAYLDTPKLADCDPVSLMRAIRRCAQLKLRPDGVEGAFIPRGRVATFQPMFQGVVRTMLRTRTVKKVEARVVHTGDFFEYEYGLDPKLVHRPGKSADQGGTLYAYAIVWLANGERQFEVMDFEALEHIRIISKRQNNGKEGPAWSNHPDEMRRKIVVKRLAKYMEQDPELAAVIDYDNAMDAGRDVEPGELLPEAEWRTLDERAEEHATRQMGELRQAIDNVTDDEDAPITVSDAEIPKGKYKGRSWGSLIEEGGPARGYVSHWVLKDGNDFADEETKAQLRELLTRYDDEDGHYDAPDDGGLGEEVVTDPSLQDDLPF